jgi:hypothetical protein
MARQGVEVAGDTAVDVLAYDRNLGESLGRNTVGSLAGEGIGQGAGWAWKKAASRFGRGAGGTVLDVVADKLDDPPCGPRKDLVTSPSSSAGAGGVAKVITDPNRLLPPYLDPKVAKTFAQRPEFKSVYGDLFRAEGGKSGIYGRWMGTVKPDSAYQGEKLYNVFEYGNDLIEVSTYTPLYTAKGWVGPVKGGEGIQVFFELAEENVTLKKTEPLRQDGF